MNYLLQCGTCGTFYNEGDCGCEYEEYYEGCFACMFEAGEINQPYDDHVHEGLVDIGRRVS